MLLARIVGFLILGPLILVAIQLAREASVVVETVREMTDVGLGTPEWVPQGTSIGIYIAAWWRDHLADPEAAKELWGRADSLDIAHWTRSLGSEAVGRAVTLAFTLLTLFFAYRDGPTVAKQGRIVADRLFGASGERLGEEATVAVRATVNGLVLVGLAEGAVLGAAYVVAGAGPPVFFGVPTGLRATGPFARSFLFFYYLFFPFATSPTAPPTPSHVFPLPLR